MNNRDIFIQEYPAHSSRTVQLADGGMAYPYSALAVGRIEGLYRSLPAVMSDDATDKDNWYVVNIDDDATCGHIQAVAVLGATSQDQAKSWAIKTIGVYLNTAPRAWNLAITSAKALKNLLDRSASRGSFPISQDMLDTIAKQITDTPVKWLSQDSCQLTSHNGNTSELLHELVKQDDQAQLVDSMNSADLACLLAELGAEEEDYNAIIVQYAKFDDFINRMNQAMGKAAVNKLSIANFTKTKPFKRNNVVNIALLWDLSDGQSMTIVFHNPDSTPSKLQAGDILTSWKFMLNKRDITAAVSPEQGKNAQPTIIAQRMMMIAEKNSARFVRTNAKKDEKVKALSELESANENTQNEIARILAQNEALQNEIDAVVVQNANSPSVIQERPIQKDDDSAKANTNTARVVLTDKDATEMSYEQYAKMVFNGEIANDKPPARVGFEDGLARNKKLLEDFNAKKISRSKILGTTKATDKDVRDYLLKNIAENEQAIATEGASDPVIRGNWEYAVKNYARQLGLSTNGKAIEEVLKDIKSVSNIETQQPVSEPPMTNPDRDYLQSIIDGKADLSNADEIEAKLTDIGDRLNADLEPLFEQAAEAFAQYAIAQAATV